MSRPSVRRLSGWGGGKAYLDPEIRDLVLDLNYHGFRTQQSCAGGKGHQYSKAWINMDGLGPITKDEAEEIKSIVRSHTDVPFRLVGVGGRFSRVIFYGPLKADRWTIEEEEDEGDEDPMTWLVEQEY